MAGLLCWKPLNYTKLHSLHEWSALSVRSLLNYKNRLHSLCQWSVSSVCYLLNYMNLHSLCEWSVFSASYLMFILPLTAKVICRSKMSHRKERADSLLFLRAGHSEPNGRPTASAGGPEIWRFDKLYWPVCEQWAYSLEARKCDVLWSY